MRSQTIDLTAGEPQKYLWIDTDCGIVLAGWMRMIPETIHGGFITYFPEVEGFVRNGQAKVRVTIAQLKRMRPATPEDWEDALLRGGLSIAELRRQRLKGF